MKHHFKAVEIGDKYNCLWECPRCGSVYEYGGFYEHEAPTLEEVHEWVESMTYNGKCDDCED